MVAEETSQGRNLLEWSLTPTREAIFRMVLEGKKFTGIVGEEWSVTNSQGSSIF